MTVKELIDELNQVDDKTKNIIVTIKQETAREILKKDADRHLLTVENISAASVNELSRVFINFD